MKRGDRKITSMLLLTVVFHAFLFAGSSFPSSESDKPLGTITITTEGENRVAEERPVNFFSRYETAFSARVKVRYFFLYPYYSEDFLSSAMTGQAFPPEENIAASKRLAAEAFRSSVLKTIDAIDIFHYIKEYAKAVTTAELTIRQRHLAFRGPSVANMTRSSDEKEKAEHSDFRMTGRVDVLDVTGGSPLGLTLQATYIGLDSRVTYYVLGEDTIGYTLGRRLSPDLTLEFSYRQSREADRLLTSFNLAF